MNVKKANEFFGNAISILGISKIILVIIVLLKLFTNLNMIFNGGEADLSYFPIFSSLIGFGEIIITIGSIIMIILNITKQPEIIKGYIMALGSVILELLSSGIFAFFAIFIECGLFIKAGSLLKAQSQGSSGKSHTEIKQNIKDTEWFYGNEDCLVGDSPQRDKGVPFNRKS